jgi:nicotinamide mononucleotide transporter
MPALDVWLYWSHGLYGDAGMAVYYTVAGVYGWAVWRFGKKRSVHKNSEAADSSTSTDELPITRMPRRLYLPTGIVFLVLWAATYWVLVTFTNSSVPVMDAFTNALSFVGLWALARKYVEQWLFWIIVDAICTYLYVIKGIPFKAGLYGLYVIIAIAGLRKWNSQVVKR